MKQLELGYYWVKMNGHSKWFIAEYIGNEDWWTTFDAKYKTNKFDEISPSPIIKEPKVELMKNPTSTTLPEDMMTSELQDYIYWLMDTAYKIGWSDEAYECFKEAIREENKRITDPELNGSTGKLNQEAIDLIEYFVKRVDEGSIRSKTTYAKYKEFLSKINHERTKKTT